MTGKWSSSGPFYEPKLIPPWFSLSFALTMCIHLALTSEPHCAHRSLTWSFSVPYFSLKWGVQRATVNHHHWWAMGKGKLLRPMQRCAVYVSLFGNKRQTLEVPQRINRGKWLKWEERQSVEQQKVWQSTFYQSYQMNGVKPDSGLALGYTISSPGDILGTSRLIELEVDTFVLCWGLNGHICSWYWWKDLTRVKDRLHYYALCPKNVTPLEGKSDGTSYRLLFLPPMQSWWALLTHPVFQVSLHMCNTAFVTASSLPRVKKG